MCSPERTHGKCPKPGGLEKFRGKSWTVTYSRALFLGFWARLFFFLFSSAWNQINSGTYSGRFTPALMLTIYLTTAPEFASVMFRHFNINLVLQVQISGIMVVFFEYLEARFLTAQVVNWINTLLVLWQFYILYHRTCIFSIYRVVPVTFQNPILDSL